VTAGSGRDLRIDAARNHERIVVAASRAFEDVGPAVSLAEVARQARVGVATVYRRFRNRDQLVRAVFEHMFTTEIEPATATETADPWRDLVTTLEATVNALADHHVVMTLAREVGAIDVDTVDRYLRSMDRLLRRARDAGLVRPELRARDLAAVVVMALATAHQGDSDSDDLRRYLALLVDGLRPASTTLPAPSTCDMRTGPNSADLPAERPRSRCCRGDADPRPTG
jgi:AcrR family transcriptional regulator